MIHRPGATGAKEVDAGIQTGINTLPKFQCETNNTPSGLAARKAFMGLKKRPAE